MSEHVVPKFRVGDVIARPTPDTHQDVKGWHTFIVRAVSATGAVTIDGLLGSQAHMSVMDRVRLTHNRYDFASPDVIVDALGEEGARPLIAAGRYRGLKLVAA